MAMYHSTGRFYENEYPEADEVVMVTVLKVDDKIGAYCSLLEYDNKEGMINLGEISKRRIRSMAKLLRVGSTELCMVVSVDEEKGYINLSKKRVAAEDHAPKQEHYAKAKGMHGVMQHVAATNEIPVEELCNKVAWPLNEKYGHALDAFKQHINGELNIWDQIDFSQPGIDLSDRSEKLKKDIDIVLNRRLFSSAVRLQAKCEVSCDGYEGIDAVKAALLEGLKASKEDFEVSIKLIAHPVFALSCTCKDKDVGMSVLDEAMALVENAIVAAEGGTYLLKSKPTFITKDEKDKEEEEKSESGSESGSSEDPENQDDTMGTLDADFTDIMKKKVDADGDSD